MNNIKGSGIKCDNPECDYVDHSVDLTEYEAWINKRCPKCNQILLTERDGIAIKTLLDLDTPTDGSPIVSGKVEIDDAGQFNFVESKIRTDAGEINPQNYTIAYEAPNIIITKDGGIDKGDLEILKDSVGEMILDNERGIVAASSLRLFNFLLQLGFKISENCNG